MAPTTPKSKKQRKEELAAITDEDRHPGVIYIGHVPHGFYEKELSKYFSQFGKVLKIKLSRSQKTGNSKGYAFVKFKYAAVAKTVAATCQNYLFFDKLLKCEYKKPEDVHEDTFHTYKWKPNTKPKRIHNAPKSVTKGKLLTDRTVRRQAGKLKKLKELGVDLELHDVVTMAKESTPSQTPSKAKLKTKSPKKISKSPQNQSKPTETPSESKEKAETPKKIDTTPKPKEKAKTPQNQSTETRSKLKEKTNTPKKISSTPQEKAKTPKMTPKGKAKTPKTTPQEKAKTPKMAPNEKAKTPKTTPQAKTVDVKDSVKNSKKRKRSDIGVTPEHEQSTPVAAKKKAAVVKTPESSKKRKKS